MQYKATAMEVVAIGLLESIIVAINKGLQSMVFETECKPVAESLIDSVTYLTIFVKIKYINIT